MASYNQVILMGYVGKDPEVKGQNGAMVTLTLATTENGYTAKNGTKVPDTTYWHNLVTFGNIANVCRQYVRKGSFIHVTGRIHPRSYTDNGGVGRMITEIVVDDLRLLDRRSDSGR